MTLILAQQSRGCVRDITIQDTDGETITPGANDKIRAIITRLGETAQLTVTSDAATANGSSFTKGATNRLRLDASDLALIEPGTYSLLVDYFDRADSSEWKTVERECIVIEGT